MVDDESLKVIDRFFEVLYDLKARRVIRGKQTFTNRYGIVRWDLNNVEKKKVLKTYQQKNLIAAFNLLETCLEVIPDMKNKKIYFAKQGQIAWLVSYVFDNARGVKQIY